jgi:hypothetical protein
MRRHCSADMVSVGPYQVTPALLIRMSSPPHAAFSRLTAALVCAGSERSHWSAIAMTPSARASRATVSSLSASMSIRNRSAPSRASASARPMPAAAPVTSAFLRRIMRMTLMTTGQLAKRKSRQ